MKPTGVVVVVMPNTTMVHMQVGSGALALGLIIPVINKIQLKSFILNRRPEPDSVSDLRCALLKDDKCYTIKTGYDGRSLDEIENLDFYFLDEELPEILFSSPELLLTTAVSQPGLSSIVRLFLANFLDKRRVIGGKDAFTYVIACENLYLNSNELRGLLLEHASEINLKSEFEGFVNSQCTFLDTVVDRVCVLTDVLKKGRPIVRVEPNYEWVIDKTPLYEFQGKTESLETKIGSSVNLVSKREYEFYYSRKTWFVNGGQLAIAAYAKEYNEEYVNQAMENPKIAKRIQLLFRAFTFALVQYGQTKGFSPEGDKGYRGIGDYALNVIERFNQMSDSCARILRPLIKPAAALQKMRKIILSLNDEHAEINISDKINYIIDFLDVQQFTGKILDRIIKGVDFFRQYDDEKKHEILKNEPEIYTELLYLYQTCILRMNNELESLLSDVRKLTKNLPDASSTKL